MWVMEMAERGEEGRRRWGLPRQVLEWPDDEVPLPAGWIAETRIAFPNWVPVTIGGQVVPAMARMQAASRALDLVWWRYDHPVLRYQVQYTGEGDPPEVRAMGKPLGQIIRPVLRAFVAGAVTGAIGVVITVRYLDPEGFSRLVQWVAIGGFVFVAGSLLVSGQEGV